MPVVSLLSVPSGHFPVSPSKVGVMKIEDFFNKTAAEPGEVSWGGPEKVLNDERISEVTRGPLAGDDDLESAVSLTRLARSEFEAFGTDGNTLIDDDQARSLLRAARMATKRQGVDLKVPWRDFTSFRTYWLENSAHGNWQARRTIVERHFGPVLESLSDAEERAYLNELTTGVSPHARLGWSKVDEHIEQLRSRFRSAATVADYRDVGNRCVGVLEAISALVYDPAVDCPPGTEEPAVDKTNIRIGAYISRRLPGKENEEIRGLANKASAVAHRMKHSSRADRTRTGICADTVILLANILRRLQEDV